MRLDDQEPLLALHGLSKGFSGGLVLRHVDLEVGPGECLGVIGPNGSGKTTLLRLLVGLLSPEKGRILVGGMEPRRAAAEMPIAYFAGERVLPRSMRAKTWARLVSGMDLARIPSVDGMAGRKLGKLSSGMRQMIGLKVTLGDRRAPLVILDEPWEHLDPHGAQWLSEKIEELAAADTTVVISSHRLHDLAGLCDRYGFLVSQRLHVRTRFEVAEAGEVDADALFSTFDELSDDRPPTGR